MALWIIFIVRFVWLGVLVYFVARVKGMQERSLKAAAHQAAQQDHIRGVAAPSSASSAEEIDRLAEMRDKGVLSAEEFQAAEALA